MHCANRRWLLKLFVNYIFKNMQVKTGACKSSIKYVITAQLSLTSY